MATVEKKRIINLAEKSAPENGDFFAVDSQAGGTKKIPTTALAKASDLTAEVTARTQADNALTSAINSASALIQNPTKTLSGALVSFTDGADMPMVACTAEIVPKQSGTGTPSPSNVRPISGWESVNLYKSGKNLLKVNSVNAIGKGITQTLNEDGTITLSGTSTALNNGQAINGSTWFKLPAGTYRFVDVGGTSGATFYYYLRVSGNSAWIRSGQTFTVPEGSNGCWIVLYFPTNTEVSGTHGLMIVSENSTYDTYEPYTGTTTTVNLGRTVYGAEAEIVSGSLTDKMGMATFDGSEAWALDATVSGITKFYIAQSDMKKLSNYTSALIANNMTASRNGYVTDDVTYMSVTGYSGSVGNYLYIMSKGAETGITAVAQLKEWLTSHNLQVVYPLAQPQIYQLTPTEVKTLLGDNNVWADSGDVEITYRRDISIVLENLENALNGSNSLNAMMMSAPAENTAEEPTEDEAEDDMR